jgi:SAM-dependent methyltransferase
MTDEGNRKREESLRVFSQAATIYDRVGPGVFSHFGQRLVDVGEIIAGTNVLDVAAGRGALLFPAAAKVGANGCVTGIDFSPDMVRETAKDIESRKLNHAEIRQMDAEQMNFADASFDWVLCGFALGCSPILCWFCKNFTACSRAAGALRLAPGPRTIRPKLGVMKCFDPLCLRRRQRTCLRKSMLDLTRRCRSKPRYNKLVLSTSESPSKKKNSSTPMRNSIGRPYGQLDSAGNWRKSHRNSSNRQRVKCFENYKR